VTAPRRRGLTLIELIVAISIGSMVIAAVLAVLTSANRTQDLGERRSDLFQCVRVSLDRIQQDLQLAVTRANDEQFTFIGTDAVEDGLPMDSLEFTSAAGDPLSSLLPTGDLLRLQYYIDTDDETEQTGFVRSAIPLPLPDTITPTQEDLSSRTYCPWAVGLDINYYDATQQDWAEEWQDRTDLPTAVRLVLYVLPEPPTDAVEVNVNDVMPFSTVVQLSLGQVALGTGEPGSGTGGAGAGASPAGAGGGGAQMPGGAATTIPGLSGEGVPGFPSMGGGGS
jgi:prepilin-type N-terminal cleavage/methylation domain-containing protein